jgi:hypothetical protein
MRSPRRFGVMVLNLAALALLFAGADQARADALFGASGSNGVNGELVILNPATGAVATDIGPLVDGVGNPFSITGLAFQPGTGALFGATSNLSPTDPRFLVSINPATGRVTPIGPFNAANGNPFGDISFDPTSGKLFGANAVGGALYTINLATGAATRISSSNTPITTGSSGHGFAVDASGTLLTTPDSAFGNLYTYNKTTGSATIVAPLSGPPLDGAINALSFDNGVLFGVNNNQGFPSQTHLITINPTTGAITDIGPSLNDLDAIAFQLPTAPPPVPEPSTLALLALGGLGLVGWRRWRKRATA